MSEFALLLVISLVYVTSMAMLLMRRRRDERDRFDSPSWWFYEDSPERVEVEGVVRSVERGRKVTLTRHARAMLIIPLVEAMEREQDFEWGRAQESLDTLIGELEEESMNHRDSDTERTSFSVIRAYSRRFCSIPPFCSPSER